MHVTRSRTENKKPRITWMSRIGTKNSHPWYPCDPWFFARSVFLELSNAIDRLAGEIIPRVGEAVFHDEGVLAAVLVVAAKDPRGPELLLAEEELGGQIRLAHLEDDPGTTV